ncbi:MAG: glycosyltransferase family 4 protein [Gammaproteobacteria bacterium]|nr:glycosyltransferase family 4 protein [Gammaproteobacteria bacterium]NIR84256.1 glycosyltransferase family 4 protein [Gammaproteobacteria bacterium]NIR89726.1 glycosyltransferase family 4 protein [Gammaproteobacteria bacterium]NIU05414.1 glycosyltransferase family 4 protein [Gammaproteobacteria bacterium]NIV52360.1 glycosyltransferase [Gammaproteobacteria bacterium]
MNVAFIVTDLSNTRIGGISRVATEVGRNLVALGHRVTAYVLRRDGAQSPLSFDGIELRYVEKFGTVNPDYPVVGFSHRAFRQLLDDLERESFDIVQTFNLNAIALPRFRGHLRAKQLPTVISSYETIMMDVRAKATEFRALPSMKTLLQVIAELYFALAHETRYLRLADAVITEDANTREALVKMRIPAKRIHLIPSGVDVELAKTAKPPASRRPWGDEGPVIGYIGRIDPRKGVQYLIDAMPRVLESYPTAHLVLAGGSRHGYDDVIRERVGSQRLDGRVHLLGRITRDILPYYKLMDVVVIPSLSEGIPITLGEAMAAEVPVVITRLPGVIPFVQPSDLVYWSDIASSESLAVSIMAALEDPDRKSRVQRAARFIAGYTWRAVAERHAEVYSSRLGDGGSRRGE